MGPPPSEDDMAEILSNPATAQMMNEALQNPQMIDLMIQSNPQLRAMGPAARQMLQSPMFRQMMTDPNMLRQAAQMRRAMGGGGGGASAFPAPGVTDTTPAGAAGSDPAQAHGQANSQNPFGDLFGAGGAGAGPAGANPFAGLFAPGGGFPPQAPSGNTPAGSPPPPASAGQSTPSAAPAAGGAGTPSGAAANPFAALFPGATTGAGAGAGAGTGAGLGGLPPNPFNMTPEQMQQMQQMAQQMGLGDLMGGGLGGAFGGFGGAGAGAGAGNPPPPADTRPPEEMYADQLRQLNDMGFFDFDANVQALRRSGGSVTGAVNSLLGG